MIVQFGRNVNSVVFKIAYSTKIGIDGEGNPMLIDRTIEMSRFYVGKEATKPTMDPPVFKWCGNGGMRNVCRASIIRFASIVSFGTASQVLPVAFIDKRDKCAHQGHVPRCEKKTNDFRWRPICVRVWESISTDRNSPMIYLCPPTKNSLQIENPFNRIAYFISNAVYSVWKGIVICKDFL